MERVAWTVSEQAAGRLDRAVKLGADLSNSRARDTVRSGKIFVDDQRTMDPAVGVVAGQRLRLEPGAPNPARTEPLGLRVVYRDSHILVVDKPAGLLSAPLPNSEEQSALHGAHRLCRGPRRPKVVHRLDKRVSGLLLFARDVPAARALRLAIDSDSIRRTYRCVVEGRPEHAAAMVTSMMINDAGQGRRGSRPGSLKVRTDRRPNPGPAPGPGKLAITRYHVVSSKGDRSAIEVRISTGRTHQIRIHLAELGCPVLGEWVYAQRSSMHRLALHAARMAFSHPITGEPIDLTSSWPNDLKHVTPTGPGW